MYKIIALQNASNYPGNPKPTIVIKMFDEAFGQALENWKNGKTPTDSEEWKKGVFAILHDGLVCVQCGSPMVTHRDGTTNHTDLIRDADHFPWCF